MFMVIIYLSIATLAVFIGAAIAFVSHNNTRLSSTIFGFTGGAVLGILLLLAFHLYGEFGAPPVLTMAGGFLWLFLIERFTHQHGHLEGDGHRWGANLALVGLSFHELTDGVNLVIAAKDAQFGAGLAVAVIAHRLPVATTLMLAFIKRNSPAAALARLTPLAVAPFIGALIGEQLLTGVFADFTEYLTAFAGGTLFHILTHHKADMAWNRADKVAGGVAFSVGIAIVVLMSHSGYFWHG
jgi:hypothetical protein